MMEQTQEPSVVIVDAMELRRAGVLAFVGPWAEAAGLSAIAISPAELSADPATKLNPRIVILSVGGASLRGAEATGWVDSVRGSLPAVPCVVLSDRAEPEEAIHAAHIGLQAFMPTSLEPDIAVQAFVFVIGGGTYFPREALLSAAAYREGRDGHIPASISEDTSRLTRRQHEVMERLRLGKSNKVIARDLEMQESTVKVHVRQIMRKLGAANRTQAALLAAGAARIAEGLPTLVDGMGVAHEPWPEPAASAPADENIGPADLKSAAQ